MLHYMAFEPATNRLVMSCFLGVWEHPTNDTWITMSHEPFPGVPPKIPSPRAMHVMSRTNGPVVLFGGGPIQPALQERSFISAGRTSGAGSGEKR